MSRRWRERLGSLKGWQLFRSGTVLGLLLALSSCDNVSPSLLDLLPSSSVRNDYPNGYIVGRNLNRVHWAGRSFRGQTLKNLSFLNADLSGTDFTDAIISNVDFTLADLNRASFRGAKLRNVTFYGARLRGVDFIDAKLVIVMLDAADVRGTCFDRAKLQDVYFEGARLTGGVYPEEYSPDIWPRSFYALLEQGACPGFKDPVQALFGQKQKEIWVSPHTGPSHKHRGGYKIAPKDEPRTHESNR
ncbi:pentapeptide repeat-containing protein [Flexibacterium corallicola]|uniref:pentapeptide repeat-containing protein n=1 Tax=Flexibacterium corallicola TaxID=3037259 RepID=UPI00286F3E57|nr:pentapeptide repeat-containing protein [Pseudovibrio sp. M1P-2-3]